MINISEYDKTFSESTFKSKVDNMFVMLHTAVMLEDLPRVDHYIGDKVYEKYDEKIKELKNSNLRQMYEELNVKSTTILSSEISEDKIRVKVLVVSRYMDYIMNKLNGQCVSGNNRSRIERNNYLTLEKSIDAEKLGVLRKCQACGANMNINESGKCEYCGTIFNEEDYDWIITEITQEV